VENNVNDKRGRRFFKGYALERDVLIQGEEILFREKPLPWLKLGEPLLAIIIASVFLFIWPYLSKTFPEVGQVDMVDFWIILRWFGLGILIIGTIALVARWFRWYFRIYMVTNKRIIEGSGTIGRSYIDCSLARIQNTKVNISILGRMLGYGTVSITTASNSKFAIKWENIRDPLGAQRKISEAFESYMSGSSGQYHEIYKEKPEKN
jgi:membrane protein YdbS with pleckstrin-like domain